MKIGILTLPLHTNYGGILQAYALQTVLERMGHETYIVEKTRYLKPLPWYIAPFIYAYRFLKKNTCDKSIQIRKEKAHNSKIRMLTRLAVNTSRFISERINRIVVQTDEDWNHQHLDAVIVGSDQIWRPQYIKYFYGYTEYAYLPFLKDSDIKKIAYAASFGTDVWEYDSDETKVCSKLIQTFTGVSVREESGVDLCCRFLERKDAIHVVDPTMLLDYEDYIPLFSENSIPSNGNLMCYVLDENEYKSDVINVFAGALGLKPFTTKAKEGGPGIAFEECIQPPLEQWLRGFDDAKLVVTDSFHACVFSILFRKPFVVIGNPERGMSRFESLLSSLGLEDRLLKEGDSFSPKDLDSIDYDEVYKKLNKNRDISKKFLLKYLA